MEKTKVCKKCGVEKPLTIEYFRKSPNGRDGFRSECKKCAALYRKSKYGADVEGAAKKSKAYREANKEKIAATKRAYSKANSVELAAKSKAWREENRDKFLTGLRKYRKANIDKIKESEKKYRELNKEKIKAKIKKYREANAETIAMQRKRYCRENAEAIAEVSRRWARKNADKCVLSSQRRHAAKRNLPHDLTEKQWLDILKKFNNKCSYCGKPPEKGQKLHQEHFIALSNNGEYGINNIVPACKSCNSSKGNRDFFEWYPLQDFYSKERERRILKHLNYNPKTKTQQLALL